MTFVKTALFHKAGEGSGGGGGGDQHNLGWYATESALTTAHATATDGDWAIVGATDTVWVWDSDTTAWKDTGQAGIELPSQTGNSGKFLTTDGTSPSWSDKPLVNMTTQSTGLSLLSQRNSLGVQAIAIGEYETNPTGEYSVTIGSHARAIGKSSVAVGNTAYARKDYEISIGPWNNLNNGTGGKYGITIGCQASIEADGAIQLGGYNQTNSDANTFKVGNANGNYEIMSADGTIPTARFTTDPVADGTYYPTLTISSGTPTRSWSTISALQNTATGANSLTILGTATTLNYSTNIGSNTQVTADAGTAVGAYTKVNGFRGTAIGSQCSAASYGVALGWGAYATAQGAIQLGSNPSLPYMHTNSDANTFKVGNANGNFEMMDANGFVPTGRLTKVNSTITIAVADWNGGTTVTKTVAGITATGVVLVSPDPTDQAAYTSAGIICTAQAADSLTFTCSTTPSGDIDVVVVML